MVVYNDSDEVVNVLLQLLSSANSRLASAMMLSKDLLVVAIKLVVSLVGKEEGGRGKAGEEEGGKGMRGKSLESRGWGEEAGWWHLEPPGLP